MTRSPHLLIVDDDRELRQLLTGFSIRHGFRVDAVADGKGMAKWLETGRFDLVVLDVMLPGEDGLALCRSLRAASNLPVIMLTALADETDRIVGLEMGADDYVVKPFNPRELLARIKAVLRRSGSVPASRQDHGATLVFDGWRLDLPRRQLYSPEGVLMPLTGGEFDLLAAFAQHPQRVLNRDQLLDLTRGRSASAYDRSVDVQLSRLRRKIESDPADPMLIKTVRGGGYLFTPRVERER
ncbi:MULTISPECIES: response regulator [Methylococcus]|uniref:Response regulator n=1 Tax=Methylococcus capsulatus TaxID=414 RepID=A0ABZ2F193_METCP|nr:MULTISPECIES: response regulator [Methylococcus]MDF9392233.1 response regulator [Methylococcus capsulatus]